MSTVKMLADGGRSSPSEYLRRMRNSSAELAPDAFRAAGHVLVDRIADFLASLPARRVAPSATPRALRELIGSTASVPESGTDAATILAEATELLLENSTFN